MLLSSKGGGGGRGESVSEYRVVGLNTDLGLCSGQMKLLMYLGWFGSGCQVTIFEFTGRGLVSCSLAHVADIEVAVCQTEEGT